MFAFVGVAVVDVVSGDVHPDQTVVVSAGAIQAVGPRAMITIPGEAQRIDGTGQWLAPGLIDFHTHERAPLNWPADFDGNGWMYLANGVTSIVNMGDFTDAMIEARESVRRGEVVGPTVYVGHFARSPSEGGGRHTIVATPADAQALVQRAVERGYDFIKVYSQIEPAAFQAMMTAAHGANLMVGGHAPVRVGLRQALDAGQGMVVHTVEFLASHFGGQLDAGRIEAVATELRARGTVVNPTLSVTELVHGWGTDVSRGIDPFVRMRAAPGREYMDDRALQAWDGMFVERVDLRQPRDLSANLAFFRRFVAALEAHDVALVTGTDNIGVPGIVPGFSVRRELAALEGAGLTPLQVLRTATSTPGRVIEAAFRGHDRTGWIGAGRRADLVLLARNPLIDLRAYTDPVGVMADGRWYPRDELRRALDALRMR